MNEFYLVLPSLRSKLALLFQKRLLLLQVKGGKMLNWIKENHVWSKTIIFLEIIIAVFDF